MILTVKTVEDVVQKNCQEPGREQVIEQCGRLVQLLMHSSLVEATVCTKSRHIVSGCCQAKDALTT